MATRPPVPNNYFPGEPVIPPSTQGNYPPLYWQHTENRETPFTGIAPDMEGATSLPSVFEEETSEIPTPMPIPPPQASTETLTHPSYYPVESENEVKRVFLRNQLFNRLFGGPLPSMSNLSSQLANFDLLRAQRVLDVACGVGDWAGEMALRHPNLQVMGIDRSTYFVDQARKLTNGLKNVHFLVSDMQALEGESFGSESFDLIHLRFVAADLHFQQFAPLLQTLHRLCKSTGLMMWREVDLPLTSSDACDQFEMLLLEALRCAGRSFSSSCSLSVGIGPWMQYWLHSSHFRIIYDKRDLIDVSAGRIAHNLFCEEMRMLCHRLRPLLLQANLIPPNELDKLLARVQHDVEHKAFYGVLPIRTFLGTKM